MDFKRYLKSRHLIIPDTREMNGISARQYNSRLNSMINQNIYCEENELNELIIERINDKYVNTAKEYERTIRYYLEFKKYLD